jgi:hypothetical protein
MWRTTTFSKMSPTSALVVSERASAGACNLEPRRGMGARLAVERLEHLTLAHNRPSC